MVSIVKTTTEPRATDYSNNTPHQLLSAELEIVKGADLVGLKYEPMFPYFADREQSFVVCEDNYVTNDSGTGIVHQVCGKS